MPVPLVRAVVDGARRLASRRSTRSSWSSRSTRPTLTDDLAAGPVRDLQVPVVGRWAIVDPDVAPGQGAVNSAQRVAAVGRRSSLQAEIAPGARVLLVDDLVVTGWTLTLAARAIRAAGASAVLPLTLAVQS